MKVFRHKITVINTWRKRLILEQKEIVEKAQNHGLFEQRERHNDTFKHLWNRSERSKKK